VVVTILVTLVTKPRPDEALRGLVYSLTDVAKEEHASLFRKPVFWGRYFNHDASYVESRKRISYQPAQESDGGHLPAFLLRPVPAKA